MSQRLGELKQLFIVSLLEFFTDDLGKQLIQRDFFEHGQA